MKNRTSNVLTAWLGSVARLGGGLRTAHPLGPRPTLPLELYEFESCPYCRKVRETLSALDLEAVVYPCPKGGTRFRPTARALGGKEQFPLLIDPNTQRTLYESDLINTHLANTYGTGQRPLMVSLGPVTIASSRLSSALRFGMGARARPSRVPAQKLELWSFEASPYCRLVRERLSELELPYLLHNVAKQSPSRKAFVGRSGKMQVPWLFDPNTGRQLHESADIIDYLDQTYALSPGG